MSPGTGHNEPSSGLAGNGRLVAIGASAGGIRALGEVLEGLPAAFPAVVAIVQHLDPNHQSLLAPILQRRCRLPVYQVKGRTKAESGVVYVAPPDHHLIVRENGFLDLTEAAQVQFARPSIDTLFQSAAEGFGDRAIAIVLTGTGSDGSRGLRAIKDHGGVTISQDRESSEFSGMPQAAILTGNVDYVLPLGRIAAALVTLVDGGKP